MFKFVDLLLFKFKFLFKTNKNSSARRDKEWKFLRES